MKTKKDYNHYLNRFQEVVCFLTAVGIKKKFKTLDAYKNAENSDKAYCLNINWEILSRLSRLAQGKKCFEEFLKLSESLFVYHRHCNKTFSSKKSFARNSWFELSDETLAVWFSDDKNFRTKTCELISSSTHKWIDKYVFYTKTKKTKPTMKIDNSDIPDDIDNEPKTPLADEEWWQKQVLDEKFSKGFAKRVCYILTGHEFDFKEGRNGWSAEDAARTRLYRQKVFKYVLEHQNIYNLNIEEISALKRICG